MVYKRIPWGYDMSSKTKIVVFHMKELIYTGIFIVLGILFIILLTIMFLPDKKDQKDTGTDTAGIYTPGVYSTTLVLGDQTIDVEVMVNADNIQSVQLKNLNDAITTMYPLIQPSFEDIARQIEEKQSLNNITYSDETKYTSMVLIDAIRTTLEKASSADKPDSTEETQQAE